MVSLSRDFFLKVSSPTLSTPAPAFSSCSLLRLLVVLASRMKYSSKILTVWISLWTNLITSTFYFYSLCDITAETRAAALSCFGTPNREEAISVIMIDLTPDFAASFRTVVKAYSSTASSLCFPPLQSGTTTCKTLLTFFSPQGPVTMTCPFCSGYSDNCFPRLLTTS